MSSGSQMNAGNAVTEENEQPTGANPLDEMSEIVQEHQLEQMLPRHEVRRKGKHPAEDKQKNKEDRNNTIQHNNGATLFDQIQVLSMPMPKQYNQYGDYPNGSGVETRYLSKSTSKKSAGRF